MFVHDTVSRNDTRFPAVAWEVCNVEHFQNAAEHLPMESF